jgi:hypothetical protein
VKTDDGTVRVTARSGGREGHGAAPDTGILGSQVAFTRALRDLNRKIERADADAYRSEWAAVTDRNPRDVYVPEALRPEPEDAGNRCWDGGAHTPGTLGVWVGRCIRCGNRPTLSET